MTDLQQERDALQGRTVRELVEQDFAEAKQAVSRAGASTEEVAAARERLRTIRQQAQTVEDQLRQAVAGALPWASLKETVPAAFLHVHRSLPAQQAMPRSVQDLVKFHVTRLNDVAKSLDGVVLARGYGHILSLELRDRMPDILISQEKLAEIRTVAERNGVNLDEVIAGFGGLPDFVKYGEPAAEPAREPQPAQPAMPWDGIDDGNRGRFFGSTVRLIALDRTAAERGLVREGEPMLVNVLKGGKLLEVRWPGMEEMTVRADIGNTYRVEVVRLVDTLAGPDSGALTREDLLTWITAEIGQRIAATGNDSRVVREVESTDVAIDDAWQSHPAIKDRLSDDDKAYLDVMTTISEIDYGDVRERIIGTRHIPTFLEQQAARDASAAQQMAAVAERAKLNSILPDTPPFRDGVLLLHGTKIAFLMGGKTVTGTVSNKFTEDDRKHGRQIDVRFGAFDPKNPKSGSTSIEERSITRILEKSPWESDYQQDRRQSFEHAGLTIYPITFKGEPRWCVQLPENKATDRVLGDTIHANEDEAKQEADLIVRRQQAQVKFEQEAQRRAAQEAEQAAEKTKEYADIGGEGDLAMIRGRRIAALSKLVKIGGTTDTLKNQIDRLVQEGYRVEVERVYKAAERSKAENELAHLRKGWIPANENHPTAIRAKALIEKIKADDFYKTTRVLTKGDSLFLEADLSKFGLDYAEHRIATLTTTPAPSQTSPEPSREVHQPWQVLGLGDMATSLADPGYHPFKELPGDWIVMNASRPLIGHLACNGDYLAGRFYAAIDPNDAMAAKYVEANRKDGAVMVLVASREQRMEMAMLDSPYREAYLEMGKDERLKATHALVMKQHGKPYGELKELLDRSVAQEGAGATAVSAPGKTASRPRVAMAGPGF